MLSMNKHTDVLIEVEGSILEGTLALPDQPRGIVLFVYGALSASSDWGGPVESKSVRPALKESYEGLMHQRGLGRFILPLNSDQDLDMLLSVERLQRAIGVIYKPETERQSHYLFANLPRQFDALIHIDKTSALQPLDLSQYWRSGVAPETFPVGI